MLDMRRLEWEPSMGVGLSNDTFLIFLGHYGVLKMVKPIHPAHTMEPFAVATVALKEAGPAPADRFFHPLGTPALVEV